MGGAGIWVAPIEYVILRKLEAAVTTGPRASGAGISSRPAAEGNNGAVRWDTSMRALGARSDNRLS